MRKSYIALSLILSQALYSDVAINEKLIADFSNNETKGNLNVTKPKTPEQTRDSDPQKATYGTDWSGSTTYLNVMTDDLTFSFNDSIRQATSLVLSDGFSIKNNLTSNSSSQTQVKITITKDGSSLKSLLIGQNPSSSNKITIGSDVNLMIKSFASARVVSNLYINSNSILDVSEIDDFTNDGGIVLEGGSSELKVKSTLNNNGTIMMREGSKIQSVSNLDVKASAASKQGSIIVQGNAEINSGDQDLTIESQNITLQNLVSKQNGKVKVASSALTLKSTKQSGTLTLGGDSSKSVNISGEIGNKDPSNISNSDIPQGSEIGKITVDGFTTLDFKSVNFKNINLTSTSATTMNLNAGTLGFENTIFSFTSASTDVAPASTLNFGVSGTSTISLVGENAITTTGNLTVKGTHTFKGSGTLDFVGESINLGNGSSSELKTTGSEGSPKIGVSAKTVNINELTLTSLTLQAIESTISNTKITFSDSVLEAIDHDGNLSELKITKNGNSRNDGSGSINVSNGKSATLRGSGISLTNQNITLSNSADQLTTLVFNSGSGGIILGDSTVSGKNSLKNNILNIQSSSLTTQGKVTLENIVVMSDRDVSIIGTAKKDATATRQGSSKGLFIAKNSTQAQLAGATNSASTLFIGKKEEGKTRFYSLTLSSKGLGEGEQAYVNINAGTSGAVDFRASSFTFQNQEIELATGTGTAGVANSADGTSSATKLRLFAYGSGLIEDSFLAVSQTSASSPKSSSASSSLTSSGSFNFSNTTFTDSSSSTVELYAGSGGITLLPTNLTLKNVSLDAKIIDNNSGSSLNTLDLSARNGSIHVLGTSTIQASQFVYGSDQGIGVDLLIGDTTNKGNLTLKSTGSSTTDNFIIGGEIALDLRGTSGDQTSIDIDIQNGDSKKLSDHTLGLTFRGGGLTVIGNGSSSSHTFKAKSFTFEEITQSSAEVVASPFVKVQNAQLTLSGASDMSEVDLVGTVYLLGDSKNETKLTSIKATNTGTGANTQLSNASDITLKLHDIQATGKASIQENKLSFEGSNIKVSNSDSDQGLLLKDVTSNGGTISGTINSITLESGKLQFQANGTSARQNAETFATITLNADSSITSSGTSSLILQTIKVGTDTSGLYSLKVTDGSFTLKESTLGTQLGAITLGDSQSSIAGTGAVFSYMNGTPSSYNALILRGNLTSYGNSSILADSFTINAKSDSENYAISSSGGILTLQTKASAASRLDLNADLTLSSGGLKYVDTNGQNAELKFTSKSTITSSGESSIEGKSLDINGASLSVSGGTLTLRGIATSTTAGNVSVGNAGVLNLQNSNMTRSTLRVSDTIALSASVPYITKDEPLGGGTFGQVVAESVLFETQGKSPLITLSLTQASSTSTLSDSLFALREGGIMLVDTNSGIKKKISASEYANITLEDVSSSLGDFTSISLQPFLKYGKDTQGNEIAEDLMLDLRVTQTNVSQLIESIKDSTKKEQMQSLLSSGNNSLIVESIMNSKDNPLKVGMASYISNGNVEVVKNALEYIAGAFIGLNDSLYSSHKVAQGLKMIRATNLENRMVRAKNPFLAKLEVAKLIKRALGVAYASNDDEILLEDEESGIKEGELWVSFDGAMGFSELKGNASVYGFSAGYDTLLGERKNYLLGFYFGYGYGSYSANYAVNNSHNVSLGLYSRMSFDNNEVDLVLSQSIGLNTTDINYGATNSYVAQMLRQSIDYNFYTTDIEARYGYVFSVGEKESPYYFRPFGGINFSMIVNSEGRGDGEAPIGMDSLITYQLSVSAGVEMRKYFGENYLYWLPMLEKGLLNDGNGTKIGFVGSQSIGYNLPYTIDTALAMYLGGQGNVGENIAISGGVGVKVGLESKEILTNWNLGLRYKF